MKGKPSWAGAVVLALGGASWPETGSDGSWPAILSVHGVTLEPFAAANCGWNVAWSKAILERAEGLPLKNLCVTANEESVSGELLITRYGLEGGALYRLGPVLRDMSEPAISIDFKPQVAAETLRTRAAGLSLPNEWWQRWKLSPPAVALLESYPPDEAEVSSSESDRPKVFACLWRVRVRSRRRSPPPAGSAGQN
jgi:predicted flavoprotein YhiN